MPCRHLSLSTKTSSYVYEKKHDFGLKHSRRTDTFPGSKCFVFPRMRTLLPGLKALCFKTHPSTPTFSICGSQHSYTATHNGVHAAKNMEYIRITVLNFSKLYVRMIHENSLYCESVVSAAIAS